MASILRLKKWGTTFVDTDNASAEDILADIEASDDRVVMVDYLQLMDVTQAKNESRELAISRVAKDLKRLAKRKGITILTGSQLNDDGKLRESRAIGQHADKVLYVNRVEVDGEIDMTRRTLLIGKNRGGKPMEKILLGFAGASFRFNEIGPDDADPDWTETMPETMPAKRRRK
jgi:replicative DNA helicase